MKAESFLRAAAVWLCAVILLSCTGGREGSVPGQLDDAIAPSRDADTDAIQLSVPPLAGFLVNPYLQNPGPHRMTVMFEPQADAIGPTMQVEYRRLGDSDFSHSPAATETLARTNPDQGEDLDQLVYAARLTGLQSNTVYEYRVVTAAGATSMMRFKTWPLKGDGVEMGRFLVISDIQGNNPYWLTRVFEQGVIARDCEGDVLLCVERFAGIIITGDMVDDGDNIEQWRDEYFRVGDSLFRYLPQMMVIGNHDYNLANYLYYAAPPSNGSVVHDEEWYRQDYLNFRLLGMQSNLTVQGAASQLLEQTAFLQRELADAASRDDIDYVFMGIHAPCKSELWIPGESLQVCEYTKQLEALSEKTGILTGHLFGHTHGYSRGQSRDVPHLWMNAASAGGRVDDWGDYAQADYDEFESTWDEYGYSILEFTTTGEPEIRSVRRTGGDDHSDYPDAFQATVDRDHVHIGGHNHAPAKPQPLSPSATVHTADVLLHAAFADEDGDPIHEAHWQLRSADGSYARPLLDVWGNETRARNDWFRRNLNEGIDLSYWRVAHLDAGDYCWRVRFRDPKLAWSGFSDDACFTVAGVSLSDNLLLNGDAESGIEHWSVSSGVMESLNTISALQAGLALCATVTPPQGLHWFALGGCVQTLPEGEDNNYSIAQQSIDVSPYAEDIAQGRVSAVLRLQLRNASKWDVPAARLLVGNGAGDYIAVSKPVLNQTGEWLSRASSVLLPPEATTVTVELTGLRQESNQGDAYFDDVRMQLAISPVSRRANDPLWPRLSPGNGMAIKPKKSIDPHEPHDGFRRPSSMQP